MALRMRGIFRYAVPGVLALVGCWWYFSRKKDKRKDKQDSLIASANKVQADDALKELVSTKVNHSSSAHVPVDEEGSAPQISFICSIPSAVEITSVYDSQSDNKTEGGLFRNCQTPDMTKGSLQESDKQDADSSISAVSEHLRIMEVMNAQTESEHSVCMPIIACIEDSLVLRPKLQVCLAENLENSTFRFAATENVIPQGNDNPEFSAERVNLQNFLVHDFQARETCPSVETFLSTLPHDTFTEPNVEPCMDEMETLVQMSVLVQCPQSMVNETEIMSKGEMEHNYSQPSECDQSEPIVESLFSNPGEGNCTDILEAFSQCLVNSEPFETTNSVVDCLEKGNTKAFLENYEAKIVEQLAINIISKVIVAAKQEILSGSTSDMSDSGCQVLDEENGEVLANDQSQQFSLEKNGIDDNGPIKISTVTDSIQTEQSQVEDFKNTTATDDSCLKRQSKEEQNIPNKSMDQTNKLSNFSPVHENSFNESEAVLLENSAVSVSTLDDGIILEDPLQSTVLSSIDIGSYDSLSSSVVELSRQNVIVSDRTKNTRVMESSNVPYSNGDVKGDSSGLKNEIHWISETEADHSAEGHDVSSMDSVDSGCAVGKSQELRNVKMNTEGKKAELVIWEIEVPKHLVGRLIGKQGRFVSFLKESSGAKIYISTLPYTQDFQICHLEGSQPQVSRALDLIGKKFKEVSLTNIYAPPPPSLALHALPMTSWLMLPEGITVEVIAATVVNAGHMFVQQHTHPTFHALCGLDQQMYLCYSQPGIPTLPTPVEVGVICAAPTCANSWWRAQIVAYYEDSEEVEIRYVDYGGYERVKIEILRQIRSDFVTLPFQGAEILLDNVIPLPGEDQFSTEADAAVNEMTRNTALLAQVINYDGATGLPLVQLWSMMADEVISLNRTIVEKGYAQSF